MLPDSALSGGTRFGTGFRHTPNTNALKYWKESSTDFPLLSMVARQVLCISASSAQSERDFSSVGRTITDARSRLCQEKLRILKLCDGDAVHQLLICLSELETWN